MSVKLLRRIFSDSFGWSANFRMGGWEDWIWSRRILPNSLRWVFNCKRRRSSSKPVEDDEDGSWLLDFERPHVKQERAAFIGLGVWSVDFFSMVISGRGDGVSL